MRKAVLLALVVALPAAAVADTAAPVERRLHLAQVEASSFLWNDWNKFQENYHPLYVADDDPATAWVEGARGPGVGEWVRLKLTPMDGAEKVRLKLRNGYQKSERLFQANARAKEVTVTLSPSGATQKHTLADAQGWQEISVSQPRGKLETIEIKIDSIYPGKKYEDLCVSDIQLVVAATTRDNPAFEKSKLEQVTKWKKERAEAAAAWKKEGAAKLPVGPQYHIEDAGEGKDAKCPYSDMACNMRAAVAGLRAAGKTHDDALALADQAIKKNFEGFAPVQAVPTDKRKLPPMDTMCTPDLNSCNADTCYGMIELPAPGTVGFLHADRVGTFDAKDAPTIADTLKEKPKQCRETDRGQMFAWALREKKEGRDTVRALVIIRCGAVESREGAEPASLPQLLVYGKDGALEVLVGWDYAVTYEWKDGILAGARRASASGQEPRVLSPVAVAKR